MRTVTRIAALLPLAVALPTLTGPAASAPAGIDVPVPHERHERLPVGPGATNDVRGIAVHAGTETVWVATGAGVFRRATAPESGPWSPLPDATPPAPTFAVATRPVAGAKNATRETAAGVWIGAGTGLHHFDGTAVHAVAGVPGPVVAVAVAPNGAVLAGGPHGYWIVADGTARAIAPEATRYVGHVAWAPDGAAWLATGMGLYRWQDGSGRSVRGVWERDSIAVRDVLPEPDRVVWAAALGGLQYFRDGRCVRTVTAAEGLPSADVRCVARDGEGRLWVGTARGVARESGPGWAVRTGRRWLVNDEVRGLAFDGAGTAWIATADGVSAWRPTPLTLAAKAARFHAGLEARHVRPPGIVEKCALRVPGDLSTWEPMDDDNDGGYTAVALAMESYRYAVTRDPAALAAARRAFAACEFLQRVTGTPGFLARTVVPADWSGEIHDPNETLTDAEWSDRSATNPRDKRVPERWRWSADRRWRWKGDTSSDEITAHFFGYFAFHELAADAADKVRVREQVGRITDHLIEHGFTLTDLDGRHTQWGVWAPERLNHDPDWAMERGINSVEILSYLKLARHVTGDAKYERHYRELVERHGYAGNTLEAPNLNPAWRTYIDFELLAFAYPALLKLETDPHLLRIYRQSFERWHRTIRADGNPFFECVYADVAGTRRANLAGARRFLAETPLDLVRWDFDATQREDVTARRHPEVEHWQTPRLLPAAEIGYSRTDQNPWHVRQGEGGRSESDGVFWLLPYWMGRHLGVVPAE